MANLHMKRCWTLLISREMQIKTTLKYYLTQVRKAIIKKSTNNKPWRGCGEKWILPHCRWKCKLLQSLWRTVWRFLKKLKRAFWERLLACMLGTSIFFGIPHTTWFGERRGASLTFVVSNALGSFFVREITKVKILGPPWTVACQAPLSMEFPRQEYWSGSHSLLHGDLPDPGIEPRNSCIAGRFFIIWNTR